MPSTNKKRARESSPSSEAPRQRTKLSAFEERYDTANKSNEEVLKKQMKNWTSSCYNHFKTPLIIVEKGNVKYQFICRTNPSITLTRKREEDSTTNLVRHVKSCDGQIVDASKSIANYAQGSTYNKAELRYLISRWVFECHRPFVIIDDAPLQLILKMLYTKIETPSATTISRDVKEIHGISKVHVGKTLQKYPGRIHVGFDGWTSPNVISFLGVVVHIAREGALQSFLLDFIILKQSHTGEYLASELDKCLREFGINEKILGQACDNASNNDTMLASMEELNPESASGVHTRIWCICHILNLVVKAILSQFSARRKSANSLISDSDDVDGEEPEDEEPAEVELEADEEIDMDRQASDEQEIQELANEVDADVRFFIGSSDLELGRSAMSKMTKLAKRIFYNAILRDDLAACCIRVKVEPRLIKRSVPTRWNSVAEMIESALHLRTALDRLVEMDRHNTVAKTRLRKLKILQKEWDVLSQLTKILSPFLQATLRLSKNKIPLLHEVIPVIDILTDRLDDVSRDMKYLPSIHASAAKGLAVLNKYYSKTDESVMYRCAMILHPKYKLSYFRSKNWPEEWIEAARTVIREQWVSYYKPSNDAESNSGSQQSSNSGPPRDDLFDTLDDFGTDTASDELEEYLNTPTITAKALEPLVWWHAIGESNPLARMAIDFLSAPASSCDVERGFSRGGLTVSKLRHGLSDESTRASTVLHAWSKIPGLIPESEIIQVFKDKCRRLKGGKETDKDVTVVDSDDGDISSED